MPGSSTTPGRSDLATVRPKRVAFRVRNSVGTRGLAFAAQWLAYALPYRRFVSVLTDANARLGADVDRYSFIVVDLHHLLLAGLPAHFESSHPSQPVRSLCVPHLASDGVSVLACTLSGAVSDLYQLIDWRMPRDRAVVASAASGPERDRPVLARVAAMCVTVCSGLPPWMAANKKRKRYSRTG